MVTGIETAGLVLGAFPLVIEGLKVYASGGRTIQGYRLLHQFCRDLEIEQVKFENTCYLLLKDAKVTDNTSNNINLGSPQWKDENFQEALSKHLQQPALVAQFVRTAGELRDIVDLLGREVNSGKTGTTHEHKVDQNALQKFLKRLGTPNNKKHWDEQLARIQQLNEVLDNLVRGQPTTVEAIAATAFRGIRQYPQGIYLKAGVSGHGVTSNNHPITERTGVLQAKPISSSLGTPSYIRSEARDDIIHLRSTIREASRRRLPPGPSARFLEMQVEHQDPRRPLMWVPHALGRELRLENTASLGDIFRDSSPMATRTLRARLKLGVQLAHAVLQLHGTHWLKGNWGSEDVYFVEGPGGTVLEQPLLQQVFQSATGSSPTLQNPVGSVPTEERGKSELVLEFCNRTLYCLGVTLIELWHWKPHSSLQMIHENINETDGTAEVVKLQQVVEDLMTCAGPGYGMAVQYCITGLESSAAQLGKEGFKNEVYKNIVNPLEENLMKFCGERELGEIFRGDYCY